MKALIPIVLCILAVAVILVFRFLRPKWAVSNVCAVCGAASRNGSQYGYSQHAEEQPEKMKPLCRECLIAQLESDYTTFASRAVVVQPAGGPPCYVFHPIQEWNAAFKDSNIGRDAETLLADMERKCGDCGRYASYLWIASSGLNGDNFEKMLDEGISQTLLLNNPKPVSVCGKCCVARIASDLEKRNIAYLEVCGPKDNADGFVVPMGY